IVEGFNRACSDAMAAGEANARPCLFRAILSDGNQRTGTDSGTGAAFRAFCLIDIQKSHTVPSSILRCNPLLVSYCTTFGSGVPHSPNRESKSGKKRARGRWRKNSLSIGELSFYAHVPCPAPYSYSVPQNKGAIDR